MLHTEFDSPQEAAHAGDSRRPLNHKSPISLVRSVVLNWHTKRGPDCGNVNPTDPRLPWW